MKDILYTIFGIGIVWMAVFLPVAGIYSAALRAWLFRVPVMIIPAIAAAGAVPAMAIALLSIIKRDNEHGIATFMAAAFLLPAIVLFAAWLYASRKHPFVKAHILLTYVVPGAAIVLGLVLILVTMTSPYLWLDRILDR